MTCEQCGGPRMASPCFEGRRFCSRECMGRWMSEHVVGEAHPMWRGGPQPYYGASWPSARRAVRNRDKVCQSCGIGPAALGSALDVHHLASFRDFGPERHKEANDHDNLVALCRPCHIKMEWATHWREPAD
jgi:5-methylcytosine-specific restriction endonuclease McrA